MWKSNGQKTTNTALQSTGEQWKELTWVLNQILIIHIYKNSQINSGTRKQKGTTIKQLNTETCRDDFDEVCEWSIRLCVSAEVKNM